MQNRLARHLATALFVTAMYPFPVSAQTTVRAAARTLLGAGFTGPEVDSVASVLAQQVSTFPVGTSSGGFTFNLDPRTGVVRLKTPSFGPLFAERASTLGTDGMVTVGVSAQSTRFVSFEGRNVRNGDLRSRVVLPAGLVDLDRFTFNVSTQTTSVSVNLGIDTHVDVGIIVPIVRTALNGTATSRDPSTGVPASRVADAVGTGLGDVVLRGKWNFLERPQGGLAAVGEVFLPTGDEERLAGTGRLRLRPLLVASATVGTFSPHVNLGYTFGGDGARVQDRGLFLPVIERAEVGDEINYTVGADVSPSPAVTVFADLVGRALKDMARFDGGVRLTEVPGVGALPLETFIARTGTLNLRLAAIGAKVLILQKGLITAGLLFPLNDGGLKPGLTPVVGLEYTF